MSAEPVEGEPIEGELPEEEPQEKPTVHFEIERLAYNVTQAAAALGIDKERMSGLIRAGTVPHISIGARRVVGKRALEEWLTASCLANARTLLEDLPPTRPAPLRPRRERRAV